MYQRSWISLISYGLARVKEILNIHLWCNFWGSSSLGISPWQSTLLGIDQEPPPSHLKASYRNRSPCILEHILISTKRLSLNANSPLQDLQCFDIWQLPALPQLPDECLQDQCRTRNTTEEGALPWLHCTDTMANVMVYPYIPSSHTS